MSNIATRFKNARIKKGLSQSDVALKMGISTRTYQRVEANPEKLSIVDLKKYTTLFVVTLSNILDEKEQTTLKLASKQETSLSDEEQELLKKFRELPNYLQEIHIDEIDRDLLNEAIKEKRKKHSNTPLQAPLETDATA